MRGWRKPRSEVFGLEPATNDEARMTNDETADDLLWRRFMSAESRLESAH
jgi:hypothetical protein